MLLRVLKNITETRFQKNTFILLLTSTSLQTSQQSLIYQIFLIVA